MIRLEMSQALNRLIRQDDLEELAVPTWTLVRSAIQAGRIEQALALMDYQCGRDKAMHDSIVSFVDDVLSRLARFGDEEIYEVMRLRYYLAAKRLLATIPGAKELLQYDAESFRTHGGKLTVREETDRYVLVIDPCGTGGQMRRAKDVSKAKKAYPWTWGMTGVPHYCVHCCVFWEIIPVELRGYPLRINLMAKDPGDPCVHLFYKKPELIPEEYFTRIGKTKTM